MSVIPLTAFFGIGGLGFGELVLVGVVAVILFGGRLPEVARNVGQAYASFRRQLDELQKSFQSEGSGETQEPLIPRLDDLSKMVEDEFEGDFDPPPFEDPQ